MIQHRYHGETEQHFAARQALTARHIVFQVHGEEFTVNGGPQAHMTAREVLAWLDGGQ